MRLACLALGLLFVPSAPSAAPPVRIAVLPTQLDKSAQGKVPTIVDELVLAAVQEVSGARVIGQDDISALLGFERQKDLLSCDDASCIAEIGGALGVDKLLVVKIGWVGNEWVVSSKLINIKLGDVERRSSEFVAGDAKALLKHVPTLVQKLFGATSTPSGASASNAGNAEPTAGDRCATQEECSRRCDRGDEEACHDLGWWIIWSTAEPQRGVAVFERLCSGGDLQGCGALGWATLSGLGTAKSETVALALFQKACAGADGKYCDGLAWMSADGRGVVKNEVRAAELFARACQLDSTAGCYGQAWMSADGRGTAKDEARAVPLFARVCAENAYFCDGLAWMKYQGRGTAKSDSEGFALFDRACGHGNAWGCYGQATMLDAGSGAPKDPVRATSLLKTACQRGVPPACEALKGR